VTQPETIARVLERLDAVVERCIREESRLGYFAALYRNVTARVRDDIAAGRFQDGPRMERLDVSFATRYLAAVEAHWAGQAHTNSWRAVFAAAPLRRPIVLQHLLLGMHAHINLDLAIAAAQVAPGAALPALRQDFHAITRLLEEMIDDVQHRLARVSPWMRVVDWFGGRRDERIVGFCLGEARELAWRAAGSLAACDPDHLELQIALHDELVAGLAAPIRAPGLLLGTALRVVRLRETASVADVIRTLLD
jgi:hypothetical protein